MYWRKLLFFLLLILQLAVITATLSLASGSESSSTVVVDKAILLDITPPFDTIDSGVAECFKEALKTAEASGSLLVYRVNSYGGLLDAGFDIGDAVMHSKIPVVAYVESKALSAGTLIILPADIIVLQKGSTIGSMQPVIVDPLTGSIQFVNESKILNPIIEKAKTYATRGNRNQSVIEDFVRYALTLNSSKAVELGVADLEVDSFSDLLEALRGMHVKLGGTEYVLNVSSMKTFSCSIRSIFISLLSNSYLANILVTIGMLASIFALVAGKLSILPLTIGLLLLGLIGTGLNANIVSVFLILLGSILLAVEMFVIPGFGVVGVSGIILLALGFMLLPMYVPVGIIPAEEYITTLRVYLITVSTILGGVFGVVIYKVVAVKRRRPIEFLPKGKKGRALDELKPGSVGYVMVEGEYWRAVSEEHVMPGEEVVVEDVLEGGLLKVRKLVKN